jgi:hypothetical protein
LAASDRAEVSSNPMTDQPKPTPRRKPSKSAETGTNSEATDAQPPGARGTAGKPGRSSGARSKPPNLEQTAREALRLRDAANALGPTARTMVGGPLSDTIKSLGPMLQAHESGQDLSNVIGGPLSNTIKSLEPMLRMQKSAEDLANLTGGAFSSTIKSLDPMLRTKESIQSILKGQTASLKDLGPLPAITQLQSPSRTNLNRILADYQRNLDAARERAERTTAKTAELSAQADELEPTPEAVQIQTDIAFLQAVASNTEALIQLSQAQLDAERSGQEATALRETRLNELTDRMATAGEKHLKATIDGQAAAERESIRSRSSQTHSFGTRGTYLC